MERWDDKVERRRQGKEVEVGWVVGDERGRRWRVEMDGCARQEQAWTLLAHRTNVCV